MPMPTDSGPTSYENGFRIVGWRLPIAIGYTILRSNGVQWTWGLDPNRTAHERPSRFPGYTATRLAFILYGLEANDRKYGVTLDAISKSSSP